MTISGLKDLKNEILREHSKRQTVAVARWVGHDKKRFRQLMSLFLRGEYRVTQRSAWIVNQCLCKCPELAAPWLKQMLSKMQEPGVHNAVPRNVLGSLQYIPVTKNLLGELVTVCFNNLLNPATPIAIQAYSMTILLNAAQQEPDLKHELRAALEQLLPNGSGGIQARTRIVLKKLG